MTTKKRAFLVTAAVCFALCISAVITAVVMSTKLTYAENHYEVTKHTDTSLWKVHPTVYGCGEIDCEYCNGQTVGDSASFESFVFYKTTAGFRTATAVLAILFGIASASLLLVSFSSSRSRPTDSAPARGQSD